VVTPALGHSRRLPTGALLGQPLLRVLRAWLRPIRTRVRLTLLVRRIVWYYSAMQIERTAKTLGGFLDIVADIRAKWQVKNEKELWFRGEGRDYQETRLRPSLYRPVTGFALKSPLDLIEIEDDLFQRFLHVSVDMPGGNTDDDSFSYVLMQHSLAPTRLLDWSDGALVALHFALRLEHQQPQDRFVYVLDPYWLIDYIKAETNDHESAKRTWIEYCRKYPSKGLDEDDWDECYLPGEGGHDEVPIPNFPLLLDFDHFSRRVSAQRSQFVLMGTDADFFNRLLEKTDARIKVIPVDKNLVPGMRVALRDAGITESVIYPDLDGLGRELKQLWAERLREPSY